jgi:YD repeat-containing protein
MGIFLKTFLPAFLILHLFSIYKRTQTDVEKAGLKGRVKTLSESEYEAVPGKPLPFRGLLLSKFVSQYNDSGFVTETSVYKKDGSLERMTFFIYNAEGNLTETRINNPDMSLGSRITYRYDDEGKKMEQNIYDYYKKLVSKTINSWGKDSVSFISSSWDGTPEGSETILYDAMGNTLVEKHYDQNGKPEGNYISLYDSLGNLGSYSLYTPEKTLFWMINYLHDKEGNRTEEKLTDKKGNVTVIKTKYPELDATHNWVKKITDKFNKPFTVTERKITYY